MLYRLALVAGTLGVAATLLIGNAGLATILAALIVPAICVASIWHARARAGLPLAALGAMAVTGGVAGAVLALLSRQYVEQLALVQVAALSQGRPPLSLILFLGITLPLVGELLKLVGPLLMRRWPRFRDEVMDGVVLGVASGVGFAAASTLVNYWPIVRDGYAPAGSASIVEWTATLVGLAVLRPLVHGATGGLVAAGIWAASLRRGSVAVPVSVGLGGAVVYSLGELLLLRLGTPAVLVLHGLVLALLLVTLRHTVRDPSPSPSHPTMGRCAARTSFGSQAPAEREYRSAERHRSGPTPTSLHPHGPARGGERDDGGRPCGTLSGCDE